MKTEYDFLKGEKGKFYHPEIELNIPIYIEHDVLEKVKEYSIKKGIEVSTIVNDWIKKDLSIIETVAN